MLSLEHPEIMPFLAEAGSGLWPLRSPKLGLTIAVKGSADLAFAAKHKKAFKFHFYPLEIDGESAVGVVTAIYDLADAPITIQTVCIDSVMQSTMLQVASTDVPPLYFFDVHNSELFGGKWLLTRCPAAISLLQKPAPNINATKRLEFYVALKQRFCEQKNDDLVIEGSLVEESKPEDVSIVHMTGESVLSHRAEGVGIYHSKLGADGSPGKFQEAQIARFLARVYPPDRVIVGPEIEAGHEFCDILAIGKHEAVAVQAKTTVQDIRRFDETPQKREARLTKHFYKALSQAKGAERAFYKLRKDVSFDKIRLPLTPKTTLLFHLIILYDKPPNLLARWSAELAKFACDATPAVVLDMPEFTSILSVYKSRDRFLAALLSIMESFEGQKRIGSYEFSKDRIAVF